MLYLPLFFVLCAAQRKSPLKLFSTVFQKYVKGDESGHFCGELNSVLENGWNPTVATTMVYGILFLSTNFHVDDGEELMLALSVTFLSKDL